MVDASIGSKTGIDFNNYKNLIGVLYNPLAVFVHPLFLQSLSFKETISGVAECIKHALTDNTEHLHIVTNDIVQYNFSNSIQHSIRFKTLIVKSDLHELNNRKILNFGHTIGHAIESYLLNIKQEVKHGECIAYGMVAEMLLSRKVLNCNTEGWDEIIEVIKQLYPAFYFKKSEVKKIITLIKN